MRFSAIPEAERSKRVHCGWPLLLQCEVSDPSAQVYWYKDGSKLHSQSGLDIISEGLLRTLAVHSADMFHSGLYCCKTKGDSITFNVDVTGDSFYLKELALRQMFFPCFIISLVCLLMAILNALVFKRCSVLMIFFYKTMSLKLVQG